MAWDLRTDVLVVGAGPAGGMAALELARRGIGVVVVDRSPFPREKVCGDALLEDSLEILGAAGLEAALQRRAHRIDRVRFSAPDGREFLLEGGSPPLGGGSWMRSLSRRPVAPGLNLSTASG